MAVKRRLMIPLTQSYFCCCSPTLSLHSAEVVMKRFTRPYSRESHRAADGAGLGGSAFCCYYCFITAVGNPFILNFRLNAGLISTVCIRERSALCLPSSLFSWRLRGSVLLAVCALPPASVLGGARDLRYPSISVFLFLNCSSVPPLRFCSSSLLCSTLSSLLPWSDLLN